ncbi:hypothetical protein OH76DRAFT_1486990 [Lentinus brumalis]|uniref:Uncharacterized protein n=1 Tax=Lentinus brumalis TaxID=2498619 RepID=A0A371CW89_9APHY|nr:hypothetical protein OH76DRAFT_1486990 [Polyporus brumalis]
MSHSSHTYPGAPHQPDGSNPTGMNVGPWGHPQQQSGWGSHWGPTPTHAGDGPRGGGVQQGYNTGPPPPPFSGPQSYTATTTTAPPTLPDDAWRVAIQTSRELTEAMRARVTDLTARNAQLEAEVAELRGREAGIAARELEVARREADLHGRPPLPMGRFPTRGGRAFAHSRGGGPSRGSYHHTAWNTYQPSPSTPSTTTMSTTTSSVASTSTTDAPHQERPPSTIPQKRERDTEDTDDVEISTGANNSAGIARQSAKKHATSGPGATDEPIDIADPLKSSEYVHPGKPDPSVEDHPHSRWYKWFCNANMGKLIDATLADRPYADESGPVPYDLPDYVTESLMGPEAEQKEMTRVEKARRRGAHPPASTRYNGGCGPWESVKIVTAHQAHNLRHRALTERDPEAAWFYRRLHTQMQYPTVLRTEGMRYLLLAWSGDHDLLPAAPKVTAASEGAAVAPPPTPAPAPDVTAD